MNSHTKTRGKVVFVNIFLRTISGVNLTTTWSFAATDSIDGDSVCKAQILFDFGCLHDGYQTVSNTTWQITRKLHFETGDVFFVAPLPTEKMVHFGWKNLERDSEENARTVPDTLASRTGPAESK